MSIKVSKPDNIIKSPKLMFFNSIYYIKFMISKKSDSSFLLNHDDLNGY